jgi:hypothetical protein
MSRSSKSGQGRKRDDVRFDCLFRARGNTIAVIERKDQEIRRVFRARIVLSLLSADNCPEKEYHARVVVGTVVVICEVAVVLLLLPPRELWISNRKSITAGSGLVPTCLRN